MRRLGLFALLLCLAGCQSTEPKQEVQLHAGVEVVPLHYDVGVVHMEITTSSP